VLQAKGAYGYAVTEGHMETVGTNIMMHTMHKLRGFDVTTDVADADSDDAVRMFCGFNATNGSKGELLKSCWRTVSLTSFLTFLV
jgi:hypothetical protein